MATSGMLNDLPAYSYQPEKARSLLKEAGYKGEIIKITVEQSQIRETEAITLQSQLKKIGMNIELNVMERGSFVSAIRKGDFSLVTYGGSTKAEPIRDVRGSNVWADTKRRTENLSGYCDKEMESFFPGLESELDAAKRMAIYHRVAQRSQRIFLKSPLDSCLGTLHSAIMSKVLRPTTRDYSSGRMAE